MNSLKIPQTLVEHLQSGLCVAWCGAGMSIASGLPTWLQLVNEFIVACSSSGLSADDYDELRSMQEAGQLDDVIDYCRDFLGEGEYRQFLARLFENSGPPSELHQKIIRLPFPAILTTNYDRLIEQTIAQQTSTIPTILTNHDVTPLWRRTSKNEFFVLKVHGDIDRPDTVVLSSQDYTQHVFGNLPFMQFIQRLFMSKTVLFLGTSLQDVYIRRFLEETRYLTKGVGMPHFALIYRAGNIQARLLRDRYNVTVISIEDWSEIPAFLDELKVRVEE